MSTPPSLDPARPAHEQIAEWLRAEIDAGVYAVDARLPDVGVMEALFGVPGAAARRAYSALEAEGRVYRRGDVGAFVAAHRIPQGLVRLSSFSEDMRRAGLVARSRVLLRRRGAATAAAAAALRVDEGTEVERLDRLRIGNWRPVAMDRTWLPLTFADMLADCDFENETIYEALERDHGVPVVRGQYRIKAVLAGEAESAHLGVSVGSALLCIDRTTFTAYDVPIYFQSRYYRTDRVSFDLQATRGEDDVDGPTMRLEGFAPVFEEDPEELRSRSETSGPPRVSGSIDGPGTLGAPGNRRDRQELP